MFILPLLSLRFPQAARSLLLYRYRRIDQARRSAEAAGYAGAMFPWQSASNGREVTQTMHLNPASGRWVPDRTYLQRHVDAAIAYNVWQYFLATGDVEFLRFYGAEMMLDIARFWSSVATYNQPCLIATRSGESWGPTSTTMVIPTGPRPASTTTPTPTSWRCVPLHAFDVLDALPPSAVPRLRSGFEIDDQELDRWDEVSRKMRVSFPRRCDHPVRGLRLARRT